MAPLHSSDKDLLGKAVAWLVPLLLASCVAIPEQKSFDPSNADHLASCQSYGDVIVTGLVRENSAQEISGLVMSQRNPGVLWAHNDGDGAKLKLYALERSGDLIEEIEIRGLDLNDVEDIALGPGPEAGKSYLYLADIGDNDNKRKEIQVIRVPEPKLNQGQGIHRSQVEVFHFEYDDDDPHDAEAIMVDPTNGTIYIVTKHGDQERHTRVYQSRPGLDQERINILDEVLRNQDAPFLKGSVVAADISSDGSKVALLFKDEATRTWVRSPGESLVATLRRPACLSPRGPGQQEALAFNADGSGYYLIPEGRNPQVFFVAERAACPNYSGPTAIASVDSSDLAEVSGLALSGRDPSILWAVNDSGGGDSRNHITAIATNGQWLGTSTLPSIANEDWEDVAVGPGPEFGRSYLYVADTGDNKGKRGSVSVHRFLEPRPGEEPAQIDTLRFEYPGDKSRDAESLFVDPISGELYIITRARDFDTKTKVYRAKPPFTTLGKSTLEKVFDESDNLELDHAIVGADISPDGLQLALIRRDGIPMTFERHPDGPAFEALKYQACRADAAFGKQDSIAMDTGGGFYQMGEGSTPTLFHSHPE